MQSSLMDVITIIELAEHIVKMKNGMSSLICHNSSSFFLSHEYVSSAVISSLEFYIFPEIQTLPFSLCPSFAFRVF